MPEPKDRRNVLLYLAAEGVIPVLGGCAGALAGGPVAGLAGVAVGKAVEKAINLFGRGIVDRWRAWFAENPEEAQAAVAELAALPPVQAREEARSIFLELVPDAGEEDLLFAVEFLSAIPLSADRALVPDPAGAGRTVPPTVSFDDPRSLLQLLPEDVPPYPASADLPGTPYRLVELLGAGGFGAVYRAVSPTLQHLPLAIKFCLDRSLLPALNQERSNLERLMRAGGAGSRHVVRLYGYDLDHPTPYLVYEFVEGGDLTRLVAARRVAGGSPDPTEVLGWVLQVAEGLAFAHRAGLVHRDLKPANVLVDRAGEGPATGVALKLADFGLGGVTAARVAARSRIGTSTIDYLSLAEQASLFRGAGTPLYMSPEQRRGAPPDARHDLYALGVVWYQLLVGDVSRELHHGWAKELAVRFGVPAAHIALIERCVGWFDERPKDAGELLPLLTDAVANPAAPVRAREVSRDLAEASASPRPAVETVLNASQVTPAPQPSVAMSESRRRVALALLGRLDTTFAELKQLASRRLVTTVLYGAFLALGVGAVSVGYVASDGKTKWAGTLLYPLMTWGLYVLLVRLGVSLAAWAARVRAKELVEEIAAEFPGEMAAWGGKAALRHPPLVRQIRQELDPPHGVATPDADPVTNAAPITPASAGLRRALLESTLKKLGATHAEEEEIERRTPAATALWGVLIGLVVGWGVGEAIHAAILSTEGLRDPFPAALRGRFLPLSTFGGIGAGLLVWVVYFFGRAYLYAEMLKDIRKRAGRLADELAAEFPGEVAAWGGPAALRDAPTVRQIRQELAPPPAAPPSSTSGLGPEEIAADPTRRVLLVARLKEHAKLLKDTSDNSDGTWVGLVLMWMSVAPGVGGACSAIPLLWAPGSSEKSLMVVFGVTGGILAAVASWWAMAAVRRHLARKRDAGVARFAADYPRLVEGWGGIGVLKSPESVAALLKTIDPATEPARPGFIRRLFGG